MVPLRDALAVVFVVEKRMISARYSAHCVDGGNTVVSGIIGTSAPTSLSVGQPGVLLRSCKSTLDLAERVEVAGPGPQDQPPRRCRALRQITAHSSLLIISFV